MHAFLIAMAIYGGIAVFGLLLTLRDGGGGTSLASLIANSITLGLCLWAVILLAQGH